MINKVILEGRLGKDAECDNIEQPIKFSLATWETFRDEEEESGWKTITTWHNITLWGKKEYRQQQAERLKKGTLIYLEGKIKNNKWTNNEGEERRSNDIVASFVKVVPMSQVADEGAKEAAPKPSAAPKVEEDDGLPF